MLTEIGNPKIIKASFVDFGGNIVDFLEYLNTLVESQGFAGTMALLLAVALISMFSMFSKRMKGLTEAITILTDKVSSPYLPVEQSVDIFRSGMNDLIWKKLKIVGNILEKNDIQTRRQQIELNIVREFKSITTHEAERLSKYKSVCGDMGKTLQKEMNWTDFMEKIHMIFFAKHELKRKIDDMHTMMNAETDKIAQIIEENGIHN